MLLLLVACGPSLPETLDATDLYGQWAQDNGAAVLGLQLEPAAQDAGWAHAYTQVRYDAGQDPVVDEVGSYVLDGVDVAFNPDQDGAGWSAEVIGVDDQALWLRLDNGTLWSLESVSSWP